jgi:hypothetical protein
MVNPVRRSLAVLTLVPVIALCLAACEGSDGGDAPSGIAGWRQQIRSTAASQLPELASSLGSQVGPAQGQYQASGGGVADRKFAYAVTTTLTGGSVSADGVQKALEGLGYDVSATTVPNGTTSITGTQGDTKLSLSMPDDAARPLAVTVTSPFVDVPDGQADAYESKVAKEPLALD